MNGRIQRFYQFGEYRIELEERLLKRGDEVVSLPPKAVELLFVLLGSAGRVMTKDELMSQVWTDSFVEESNLAQNIFLLRKVLGGSKNSKGKFIETIPRRGYRFVADVKESNGEATVLQERTLTQIVFEEEIEIDVQETSSPVIAPLQLSKNKKRTWRAALLASAGLVTIVGAFWFFGGVDGKTVTAMPPMRVVPVTSYPDYEFEPSLSPDGSLVAFSWSGGGADPAKRAFNIYVKQPGVGEALQVTHDRGRSSHPAFSPDGRHIAYVRGQAAKPELIVIPALGGAERKLYEASDIYQPKWSPDGKSIVFSLRHDPEKPRGIWLINVDTLALEQLTLPLSGEGDNYASISPDGNHLAFARTEDRAGEIFVKDLAGGDLRRLTFDSRNIKGLTWTPDGKQIVFASNRGGSYMLWRIGVDGGEPSALAGIGEGTFLPSVSREGNRLAYHYSQIDSNIWRVPIGRRIGETVPAASKIVASSQRDESSALSPDGTTIAFSSMQSGTREIWLAEGDGANPRQLTTFAGGYLSHPAWSPDGKKIAFDARPSGKSVVFVVTVESAAVRAVTDEQANSIAPSWSADGNSIYYGTDRGGEWQVWKSPSEGGDSVQITRNGGYEARESADGRSLYYNKAGFFNVGLFRQQLHGTETEEVKILDLPQLWSIGDWAQTDIGIYFVSRYGAPNKPGTHPAISFLDFGTGRSTQIVPLPRDPIVDPGLCISPDGEWLYYSTDDTHNSDIMLVENFR